MTGTVLRTVTGADGRYTLTDVPVRARTLVVRAIGFTPVTQAITVEATGTTVDLLMDRSVVMLDELVATATGEQARRAVASAMGTIQADSIARFAAVTTVDQVLGARIPGVAVTPSPPAPWPASLAAKLPALTDRGTTAGSDRLP